MEGGQPMQRAWPHGLTMAVSVTRDDRLPLTDCIDKPASPARAAGAAAQQPCRRRGLGGEGRGQGLRDVM